MAPTAGAVSPEDREKIVATATNYVRSWIDGFARCGEDWPIINVLWQRRADG